MRTLAFVMSLGFVLWPSAMPATFAQEAARVLGTIERVEGDKFVLKWSDKAALVLTLADGADEMTEGQGAIATNAKSFLEYQYVEIKDLSKEFLAVIAGILALSVTFSEKIIDLPTASLFTKGLLIAIWSVAFLHLPSADLPFS
jgi:hypothetical protein